VVRCARLLVEHLEGLGLSARLIEGDGNPLVYDLPAGGASDTVFIDTVVGAIETVATWVPFDIDTGLRDDPTDMAGVDVVYIAPLSSASADCFPVIARRAREAGTMVAAVLDAHKGEVFFAAWLVSEGRGHDDASVLPAEDGDGDAGSGGGPGMAGVAGAVISPPAHAAPEDAGRRLREDAERVGAERVLWVGDGVAVHRAALTAGFAERDVGLPRKEAPGGAPAAASAPVLRFLPGWLGAPRAAWAGVLGQSDFRRRGPDDLGRLEPRYVRGSDARLPANPTASRAGGG